MVRVLFVIAERNFNDTEYFETRKALEKNGIEVRVASTTNSEAIGMEGAKVKPDVAVVNANQEMFDSLIIIGGSGSPKLAEYPEVLNMIRVFHSRKKLVGAICLGPTVLARAGILKNSIATVFPADWAITSLKNSGARYMAKPVINDGDIVTADGPGSARAFGEKLAEKLKE